MIDTIQTNHLDGLYKLMADVLTNQFKANTPPKNWVLKVRPDMYAALIKATPALDATKTILLESNVTKSVYIVSVIVDDELPTEQGKDGKEETAVYFYALKKKRTRA